MKLETFLAVSALGAVAVAQQPLYAQCGGNGWSGGTSCVSGACCVFQNDWYSQCLTCTGGATTTLSTRTSTSSTTSRTSTATTTSRPTTTTGSVSTPTGVTRSLPASAGSTALPSAVLVSGSYDGGMRRFERNPNVCEGQAETSESGAMFILESGATLSNVIIGASQAEGVHCRGPCTLINVWWADVCEDAATFKQTSGTSYVIGGGAFHADDKIFQFNGRGTVSIRNFYANDYGKVARSCGDCSNNGGPRNFIMDNVVAVNGGVLCGINTNYGDTCRITNSCQNDGATCDRYRGVEKGSGSSSKIGEGPDGTYCTVSGFTENC